MGINYIEACNDYSPEGKYTYYWYVSGKSIPTLQVTYSLTSQKYENKLGYHIGLLIMSALQYLAPDFIKENRLCWLRSPLYIVKNGKEESYYFTDEEFNAARSKIKGEVQRAKGLGALSPEQAHRSMFTKEFQRLEVLEPTQEALIMLNELMGEEVEPRRQFIFNNIDFSEVRE